MATQTKIRQQIVRIMSTIDPGFTPKMCARWTSIQLLNLAAMIVGHRRYLGLLEPGELIMLAKMEELVRELQQVN